MPCDRSGILVLIAVLLIVERNVIAVLGRTTAACKLCNIRIAQTTCLEHLRLLMFSAENIEQVLSGAVVLFADRATAFTFWLYIAIKICSISTNNMKNRFL